jgi:SAM-dependent methyltransferase
VAETGERFAFGANWQSFSQLVDLERLASAQTELVRLLRLDDLSGRRFLDIGCGSGLHALAAHRLGAHEVVGIDLDPTCVDTARALLARFGANGVFQVGDILGGNEDLGEFDIVYSWGVLHHTGDMWTGLENAQQAVAPGGKLFIAIYNDTGTQAKRWLWIKKTYNKLPGFLKVPFAVAVSAPEEGKAFLRGLLKGRPGDYVRMWKQYGNRRGMNHWYDLIDWVGGYPYEVATADQLFEFYKARGFALTKMKCGYVGLGCNELVFERR